MGIDENDDLLAILGSKIRNRAAEKILDVLGFSKPDAMKAWTVLRDKEDEGLFALYVLADVVHRFSGGSDPPKD